MQPNIAHDPQRVCRTIPIAVEHDLRTAWAYDDLPRDAMRQFVVVIVEDADIEVGVGAAGGPWRRIFVVSGAGHARSLRKSVTVRARTAHAETGSPFFLQSRWEWRAARRGRLPKAAARSRVMP